MIPTTTLSRPPSVRRTRRTRLSGTAREALLVSLGASALAAAMTWPTLRDPTRTIAHNYGDPALEAWAIAWPWHIVRQDPTNLWHGNAFYPEPYSYAFTDSFLGYSLLGVLGHGPAGAILAVNLVYVFITALATAGGYALARQLGAGWGGAAVAGVAVAYAPWRLVHAGHLHVISTGGIMLALAMLARGHGWSLRHRYRPERCHRGWILAGWAVAAWQITIGFGIGLVFAYVLAGIAVVAVAAWLLSGRPRVAPRILLTDAGGILFLLAVTAFMAWPYLKVIERFPYAKRTEADLAFYSPPLRGFLIGPPESAFWGAAHTGARATLPVPAEMALLPGFALYGLALLGLVVSVWTLRQRMLLFAGTVATIALAMGTQLPGGDHLGYVTLYRYLPGFEALRTPGRLVVWTTLLLALLAAGAVTRVGERLAFRPRLALLAGPVAVVLVLTEGRSALPNPEVPRPPAALTSTHADVVRPPLLVLPSDASTDLLVMLWSTDGFPQMVNGSSGFGPVRQRQIRAATAAFPDQASVALLRRHQIATVVVLRDRIEGTPWAGVPNRPITGLGITRQEIGDAVVYDLNPR